MYRVEAQRALSNNLAMYETNQITSVPLWKSGSSYKSGSGERVSLACIKAVAARNKRRDDSFGLNQPMFRNNFTAFSILQLV